MTFTKNYTFSFFLLSLFLCACESSHKQPNTSSHQKDVQLLQEKLIDETKADLSKLDKQKTPWSPQTPWASTPSSTTSPGFSYKWSWSS